MVFEIFKSGKGSGLDLIEEQLQDMLSYCQETFGLAVSALLREQPPEDLGKPLRKSDRRVNKGERAIRRELVVHASVHGAAMDIPILLTYMSIIKDVERVGDYSKNIWDLAASGFDPSEATDRSAIEAALTRTGELIDRTAEVFKERDGEGARTLLPILDDWQDEYDALVEAFITSEAPSREGVPRALLYRHLKRITAHLMNVMTAVVMPLDRLDYWDENKADREI